MVRITGISSNYVSNDVYAVGRANDNAFKIYILR